MIKRNNNIFFLSSAIPYRICKSLFLFLRILAVYLLIDMWYVLQEGRHNLDDTFGENNHYQLSNLENRLFWLPTKPMFWIPRLKIFSKSKILDVFARFGFRNSGRMPYSFQKVLAEEWAEARRKQKLFEEMAFSTLDRLPDFGEW